MRKGNLLCRKGWSGVAPWILAVAVIFGPASGAFAGIEPSPFKDISKPSKAGRPPAAQQNNQQQTSPQQQGQDPGTIAAATAKPDLECIITVSTLGTESVCGGTTQIKRGSVQSGGTVKGITTTPCVDKMGHVDNTKKTIIVVQEIKWNYRVKNSGPGATLSGKQIRVTRSLSKPGGDQNFPQETVSEVLPAGGFKDYGTSLNPAIATGGLYKAQMTVEYDGAENNNYKGNNTCSHYFTLQK